MITFIRQTAEGQTKQYTQKYTKMHCTHNTINTMGDYKLT